LIAILDYGSGNLRSAQRACEETTQKVIITSDASEALSADGLVVPGVGSFGGCMEGLHSINGADIIRERNQSGKKTLGICVGMQILFESSEEKYHDQEPQGLGLIPGKVVKLRAPVIPHIGWNLVATSQNSTLFQGIEKERFYFVHSFAATSTAAEIRTTTSEYGANFIAAIETDTLSAVQFHPEKSGNAGLQLLKNWAASL
jgi:glutamine amidotransferase